MGGACSIYGERKGIYWVLVGKPDGKSSRGRTKHRREDHITMVRQKSVTGAWKGLSWPRTERWQAVVNTVMKLRFP